jgi:ribosome-binding protein aMBF1 (putative translation factor)
MSIEAIASETHAVGDWFRSTPESERLLSEERVLLEISELVCEALERRGLSRSALADRLEISRSEVSQRLGGRRNLSLRSLADMLHALDFGLEARLVDRRANSGFCMPARVTNWTSDGSYRQSKTPLRVVNGMGVE